MQSLVARLENKERNTSKDISCLRDHIVSIQSRVDFSLVAISKSLQVLQTLINGTARRMEIIESLVQSLRDVKGDLAEIPLPDCSWSPWSKEDVDWINSLMEIQEPGTSADITCSETIFQSGLSKNDPILVQDGIGAGPEWGSPGEPIKSCLKRT
jgi:hypothetical protein